MVLVADRRDQELGALGHTVKSKETVKVGHSTLLGANDTNTRADDRLAGSILHNAIHSNLCIGSQ